MKKNNFLNVIFCGSIWLSLYGLEAPKAEPFKINAPLKMPKTPEEKQQFQNQLGASEKRVQDIEEELKNIPGKQKKLVIEQKNLWREYEQSSGEEDKNKKFQDWQYSVKETENLTKQEEQLKEEKQGLERSIITAKQMLGIYERPFVQPKEEKKKPEEITELTEKKKELPGKLETIMSEEKKVELTVSEKTKEEQIIEKYKGEYSNLFENAIKKKSTDDLQALGTIVQAKYQTAKLQKNINDRKDLSDKFSFLNDEREKVEDLKKMVEELYDSIRQNKQYSEDFKIKLLMLKNDLDYALIVIDNTREPFLIMQQRGVDLAQAKNIFWEELKIRFRNFLNSIFKFEGRPYLIKIQESDDLKRLIALSADGNAKAIKEIQRFIAILDKKSKKYESINPSLYDDMQEEIKKIKQNSKMLD